jgi:hypothetical protein
MPVKTRPETDNDLSIPLAGNLHADSAAQRDDSVVDDAVINLHPVTALAQHASLVKRVQVLGHVGLCGVDFRQQLAHIFLAIAQGTDDAQTHRCRHDSKNLGGFFKNLFRFGQVIGFCWGCFGHFLLIGEDRATHNISELYNIFTFFHLIPTIDLLFAYAKINIKDPTSL